MSICQKINQSRIIQKKYKKIQNNIIRDSLSTEFEIEY